MHAASIKLLIEITQVLNGLEGGGATRFESAYLSPDQQCVVLHKKVMGENMEIRMKKSRLPLTIEKNKTLSPKSDFPK